MARHGTTRRSFLARVAGGTLIVGGPMSLIAGGARAQVTDQDPSDPSGRGRGGGTGITDSDSGPGADPAGRGRGTGPSQSRGNGPVTGVTDRDGGPSADPPQRGRGTLQHQRNARDCQDIDRRLTRLQNQINEHEARIQQLEVTRNWIASDMQGGDPRPDLYVQRAQALGVGVVHGSSPDWVMQKLDERAEEIRNRLNPLIEEASELRRAQINMNCGGA